jgi:hypothetical protein
MEQAGQDMVANGQKMQTDGQQHDGRSWDA